MESDPPRIGCSTPYRTMPQKNGWDVLAERRSAAVRPSSSSPRSTATSTGCRHRAPARTTACMADASATERTVDSHISRLRKKLEPAGAPGMPEVMRGVGYRLRGAQ